MDLFYADHFVLPLPVGHRFPMAKYQLLRQRVIEARLVDPERLIIPPAATSAEIGLVHHLDYLDKVFNGSLSDREIRRIGFPWSEQMVERARRSVGGTIAACRSALADGATVEIPDFRREAVRKKFEKDDWSPDPARRKKGQPWPSVEGRKSPSAFALSYARKIWKKAGYKGE